MPTRSDYCVYHLMQTEEGQQIVREWEALKARLREERLARKQEKREQALHLLRFGVGMAGDEDDEDEREE